MSSTGKLVLKEAVVSGGAGFEVNLDGGGVWNQGTLTITDSDIHGSVEFGDGGAVFNAGRLTITNSTIVGGTSYGDGGGVSNSGTLTITSSRIRGGAYGFGGGVDNHSTGTLRITNSTFSNSFVRISGGGVNNGSNSTATITNSTITGNGADHYGGGIDNSGSLTITGTLVSGNYGPELYNSSTGAITATAFNLFGHDGNAGVSGFTPGPRDIVPRVPLDAILTPTLANNGGPTLTHALVPGSPALNAITSGCPPPATDQRGVPRPHGPWCDIGAVEAVFCGDSPITILGPLGMTC